jgi:hypothetical protein
MTIEQFLFSFTFVFGVLYFLSHTKLFTITLTTFTEAFTIETPRWLKLIGYWGVYLSLFYQSFFWAKFLNII